MAELSRPAGRSRVEAAEGEREAAGQQVAERRVRRLDIVGHRNLFFAISLIVIIPGIVSMLTRGFLLGIDFAGGSEFQLRFQGGPPSLQAVEAAADAQYPHATVQETAQGTFIIRTPPLDPAHEAAFEETLGRQVGTPIDRTASSVTQVGPTIAREIVQGAVVALVVASICILFYLAFRFRKVQGGWR
ncbi:MAG TPA: hypothetical protein VFD01_05025, partial [Candidatus Dormibacteraeota bacterium]|nr:hypothetical protein [Candidatus Dormibacteraeota bacterium]